MNLLCRISGYWLGVLTDPCSYLLRAACNCRSFCSDNAMLIGKRISWLACTVESKAYLREYDVEWVFGAGLQLLLFMKLHQ
jgi:hypothetical protein